MEKGPDPSEFTVNELVDMLTENGVELPGGKQRKQVYVDLVKEAGIKITRTPSRTPRKSRSTKKIEASDSDKGESSVFTSDNVFQSTATPELRSRTKQLANEVGGNSASPMPFMFKNSPRTGKKESAASVPKTPGKSVETPRRFLNLEAITPKKPSTPTIKSGKSSDIETPGSPAKATKSPKKKASIPSKSARNTQKKLPGSLFHFFGGFIFINLLVALVLICLPFGHWIHKNKDTLAYCTPEKPALLPHPLNAFLPSCIPCPKHSICSGRTITGCKPSYEERPSLIQELFPSNYLPFFLSQPLCVKNKHLLKMEERQGKILNKVRMVADNIVRKLLGDVDCGHTALLKKYPSIIHGGQLLGLPETYVKTQVQKTLKKIPENEFNQVWNSLLDSLLVEEGSLRMLQGPEGLMMWTLSPLYQSRVCLAKKWIIGTLKQFQSQIVIAVSSILFLIASIRSIRTSRARKQKANIIVHDVLSMVFEETQKHRKDSARHPIPGLSTAQLRDYLLPEVMTTDKVLDSKGRTKWNLSPSERKKIWKQVESVVKRNSSIRETMMELKGDVHEVWQWIGSDTLDPKQK